MPTSASRQRPHNRQRPGAIRQVATDHADQQRVEREQQNPGRAVQEKCSEHALEPNAPGRHGHVNGPQRGCRDGQQGDRVGKDLSAADDRGHKRKRGRRQRGGQKRGQQYARHTPVTGKRDIQQRH